MTPVYHTIHEQLRAYLHAVLVIEGTATAEADAQPAFTNGMPALCCKTARDANGLERMLEGALYSSSIPDSFWSADAATTIVVYFFKPFALTTLFSVPAADLSKRSIRLEEWSPHTSNAFKAQLMYAGTTAAKIEALDNLLLQQHLKQEDAYAIIQYSTDAMIADPSNEILAEILTTLNLKERTLQRIFKKYVGITPTQFRRICQFQGSFDQLRSKKFDKLSDVAFDHGFADQSHFIRSFKEFTDTTPEAYLNKGFTDKK